MDCAILYNDVGGAFSCQQDVMRQCAAIEAAIGEIGWRCRQIPCTLDLSSVRESLQSSRPDVVVNLVESLGQTNRLMPVAALLLESLRIPFTGSGTLSILTSASKLIAKQRMLGHQIPTPAWLTANAADWIGLLNPASTPEFGIVKAVAEHASRGLTDDSVVACGEDGIKTLQQQIRLKEQHASVPLFAEQFIDGREFNLSVLASVDGPEVLPPAEIEFTAYPPDKPRIVGQNARWNEQSAEYVNTPRRFDFPASDLPLLDELCAIARRCWTAFDLSGYARVDFRVDADGQPWVLEINANPSLSPDAAFAAAISKAELAFPEAIRRIIMDAVTPD